MVRSRGGRQLARGLQLIELLGRRSPGDVQVAIRSRPRRSGRAAALSCVALVLVDRVAPPPTSACLEALAVAPQRDLADNTVRGTELCGDARLAGTWMREHASPIAWP